jgi:hypothetical protein
MIRVKIKLYLPLNINFLPNPVSKGGHAVALLVETLMLQAGKSRDRVPTRCILSIYLILPAVIWPWGRLSLLTEMSTWNLPGRKERPAHKADYFTAICEPND